MFNRMLALVFVVVLAFAVVVPATAQTTCTPEAPCQLEAWIAFSDHRLDWAVDALTVSMNCTHNTTLPSPL